jgi:hypothetical protein
MITDFKIWAAMCVILFQGGIVLPLDRTSGNRSKARLVSESSALAHPLVEAQLLNSKRRASLDLPFFDTILLYRTAEAMVS